MPIFISRSFILANERLMWILIHHIKKYIIVNVDTQFGTLKDNPKNTIPDDENSLERAIGSNVNSFGTRRKQTHLALMFEWSLGWKTRILIGRRHMPDDYNMHYNGEAHARLTPF